MLHTPSSPKLSCACSRDTLRTPPPPAAAAPSAAAAALPAPAAAAGAGAFARSTSTSPLLSLDRPRLTALRRITQRPPAPHRQARPPAVGSSSSTQWRGDTVQAQALPTTTATHRSCCIHAQSALLWECALRRYQGGEAAGGARRTQQCTGSLLYAAPCASMYCVVAADASCSSPAAASATPLKRSCHACSCCLLAAPLSAPGGSCSSAASTSAGDGSAKGSSLLP